MSGEGPAGGGGPPNIPPPLSPGNNSVGSGLTAASGPGSVVSAGTVSASASASAAPSQTTTPLRNASGGQQQQQQQQQFTAATAAALAPAWPNLSGGGGGGVPSSPVARTNAINANANANANAMPGTPLQQTKTVISAQQQQQGTPLVAAASPGAGAGAGGGQQAPYASPGPAASAGAAAANTTPMRVAPNSAAAAAGAAAAISSPSSASQQQKQQQQAIGPPPPTPVQPHPGAPPPLVPSLSTQTSASAASTTEQGVALGVEALERQQALVEQRRASAAAVVRQRQAQFQAQQQAQQQQQQQQLQVQQQQQQQARHPQAPPPIPTGPSYPVPRYPGGTGTDDDTVPSSVSGGGGGAATTARPRSGSNSGSNSGGGGGGGVGSSTVRRSGSFAKLLTPLKRLSSTGPEGKEGRTPLSAAGTELMSPPPGQLQQQSRRQRNNPAGDDDDDDDNDPEEGMWADHEVKPLVYGYLHKLGRNGQWQKRFFETDGECLTYYKTRQRKKLLASLDLLKVGDIRCDEEDPEGCVFAIQVSDRPYYLRAETKAACKDWVINLNRVREARLEIGGIQLVQPHFSHEYNEIEVVDGGSTGGSGGDRNRSESDEYAARVVMIANRNRTRAIATTETEESLKQIIQNQRASSMDISGAAADLLNAPPSPGKSGTEGGLSLPHSPGGRVLADHLPPVVLARWQKRRSNFQRLRYRLTQWARKINVMACTVIPHHDVSHEYTPDTANFAADHVSGAGAAVRGTAKLSDIDEHSREQDVHQVDSAISSGGESGDYEHEEPRELS